MSRVIAKPVFILTLLLLLLSSPLRAQPTMAELNNLYEGLVAEEAAILEQQEVVERNVQDTELILIVKSGGDIVGYTREELTVYFNGVLARVRLLDVSAKYLNSLPYLQRSLLEVFIESGAVEATAIETLARRTSVLRSVERDKLHLFEQELAQIRAQAVEIQRQREELREWINRGDSSGFAGTPTMSVCWDDNIPADYLVSEASSGYGGSGGHKAKGDYICIWAYSFLLKEGNVFARYYCDQETGLECYRDENRSYEYERFDDFRVGVVQAYRTLSGNSTLRYYPAE